MLPSREELLAKAAALEEPPVAFGASWDGDTQGWFVILYAMLSGERCRHLSRLRGAGGDFRIFVGEVPPWPEAELAQAVGTELAVRYGVPFTFASPERPQSGFVPAHTMTAHEEAHAAGAHARFLDNVEQLREYSRTHTPSEVLGLLIRLVPDLEPSGVVFYFKTAFPQVPLRNCIEAQQPAQLCKGGLTDEQFDALMTPWPAIDTRDQG
jgi:hypothetical protein